MTEGLIKYRKKFLEEWFDFNGAGMFLILCLVYFALLFVKKIFIIDTIAAFEILNERGDMWVFDIIYNVQYLSIPIFLTWKFIWTTLFLWIGCFMFGYRLHFNQLYKLVMLMEILFFIPEILKILWFTLVYSDPNYNDYMAFYPFSLINLFDYTQIDPQWHYPLKSINIFELLYWPLMTFGIYFLSGKSFKISSYIVSSSYILFYLIWLGFYIMIY
jgi:hypothetical protein